VIADPPSELAATYAALHADHCVAALCALACACWFCSRLSCCGKYFATNSLLHFGSPKRSEGNVLFYFVITGRKKKC
jgi:hypothetical protein